MTPKHKASTPQQQAEQIPQKIQKATFPSANLPARSQMERRGPYVERKESKRANGHRGRYPQRGRRRPESHLRRDGEFSLTRGLPASHANPRLGVGKRRPPPPPRGMEPIVCAGTRGHSCSQRPLPSSRYPSRSCPLPPRAAPPSSWGYPASPPRYLFPPPPCPPSSPGLPPPCWGCPAAVPPPRAAPLPCYPTPLPTRTPRAGEGGASRPFPPPARGDGRARAGPSARTGSRRRPEAARFGPASGLPRGGHPHRRSRAPNFPSQPTWGGGAPPAPSPQRSRGSRHAIVTLLLLRSPRSSPPPAPQTARPRAPASHTKAAAARAPAVRPARGGGGGAPRGTGHRSDGATASGAAAPRPPAA
ncbi:proline-rich protein 2-like [Cuculus canorus]|uniref:proline-rich protein 2-like n=1 Tax=Cuculus canorus TaxID=55661 RepID=UPI0023AB2EA7|nr:proline-rich protein 2-like [Cuculus canorus]